MRKRVLVKGSGNRVDLVYGGEMPAGSFAIASKRQQNWRPGFNRQLGKALKYLDARREESFKVKRESDSRCPFMRTKKFVGGSIGALLGRKPKPDPVFVAKSKSATTLKDKRYAETKAIFDQDFLRGFAAFRFPKTQPRLGISAEQRQAFAQQIQHNPGLYQTLEFVGNLIVDNTQRLIDDHLASKGIKPKKDSPEFGLIDNFSAAVHNAVSHQIQYFHEGMEQLANGFHTDLRQNARDLLDNNVEILKNTALMQFGVFRKLLNELGVYFLNPGTSFSEHTLDLSKGFEIRSVSEDEFSPALVPKEELLDKLEAEIESDPFFTSIPRGQTNQALDNLKNGRPLTVEQSYPQPLDSAGETRGCLANHMKFDDETKKAFPDIAAEQNNGRAYSLRFNLMEEFAAYTNDVIEDLIFPHLDRIMGIDFTARHEPEPPVPQFLSGPKTRVPETGSIQTT